MRQYYVRDVGLVLVSPAVQVAWHGGVRQKRKDRVTLEPLLVYGLLEVYSASTWDEAAITVRG